MTTMNKFGPAIGLLAVLALGACGTMDTPANASGPGTAYPQGGAYQGYGVVQSIDLVRQDNAGSGIGVGTVAGAIVGGIVGNQIGVSQAANVERSAMA